MAHYKLAEGIRKFAHDVVQLENLMLEKSRLFRGLVVSGVSYF